MKASENLVSLQILVSWHCIDVCVCITCSDLRCIRMMRLWSLVQVFKSHGITRHNQSKLQQKKRPHFVVVCIWDHSWSRGEVIACCDNVAVVTVLNSPYSKDKLLMEMLRCLFFIEVAHNFKI